MENASLRYIDSADEASAFIRWMGERRPILAIDTETTGLTGWWRPDYCRLVVFGDGAGAWAVSVRDWRGVIEEALRGYEGPTAWLNVKFDLHALEGAGLSLPNLSRTHDVGTMDRLIEPNRGHGLKQIADRYWPGASAGQVLLKDSMARNHWSWASVPVDHPLYWQYAALDGVLTARIAEKLWPEIAASSLRPAYDREMAVCSILYRAESRGLRIDPEYTSNLRQDWTNEMDTLTAELNALGLDNPSSGRQIAAAMQLTEKWDPEDYTDTGQIKVDESVLKGIDSEISRRVLRYRRLRKWTSTYLDVFLRDRDENNRVHASINTFQARTGRMSITGPPLQTLPRGASIRNCVIPDDGHFLWEVDYANQEARIFTHYSGDPGLIEALRNGADFHLFIAQQVYGDPTIAKNDPRRQVAKSVNFAKIYGAGPAKIAETAGVSESVIREFLSMYDDAFPGVATFMRKVDGVARERLVREGRAYVITSGGRRVTADPKKLYSLCNYVIQGSAADVLKDKIIAVDASGYGDNIVLPVHDSLLFQIPTEDSDAIVEICGIMKDDASFSVPLPVDVKGPLDRWGSSPLTG